MTPLNFLKSYFGEKYAMQVAFLLHYQSWLLVPTGFGAAVLLIQIVYALRTNVEGALVSESVDNFGNAFYGIFISIWASLMIESWKRTEKTLAFDWAIEKQALIKDDERTDDFVYNWIFNDSSNSKQKQKV